jgi:serine phosphatase RsbU (regulator of sigma subunit)
MSDDDQDLLQFVYQLPVGVMSADEDGTVSMMNPAAVAMLMPELQPGEDIGSIMPVLDRLVPEVTEVLRAAPNRTGPITIGDRALVDCADGTRRFEISVHRIRVGSLMIVLRDVTEEKRLQDDQRARALRLQQALLGRIDLTNLELSTSYTPAQRGELSGGDWYDVIRLDDDRYALVVGDVVGHDIEASATMGQLRAVIRAYALIDEQPDAVLRQTDTIAQTIEAANYTTLSYVVFNCRTGLVHYTSAGHPPPLVIGADGSTRLLTGGRRPALATFDDGEPHRATTTLNHGDVIVLYTDGLIERRSEPLDQGLDRLQAVASDLIGDADGPVPIETLIGSLVSTLTADSDHRDDVCVLAVRHRPLAE